MEINMNKKQVILGILSFLLLCAMLASGFIIRRNADTFKFETSVYFFNSGKSGLAQEDFTIRYHSSHEIPDIVLEKLIKGPSSRRNARIMDKNTKVNSVTRDRQSVTVDFSKEYLSEDNTENMMKTYAVIKTLCHIPGISEVCVTADGKKIYTADRKPIGAMAGSDINLETDTETSESRYIVLFFGDKESNQLMREIRRIKITDTQPLEQYIINELIKGPEDNDLTATLASDTGLISVETTDGTCFVNFKSNFVSRNLGTEDKEKLAIYSIVNSLTELSSVKSVQFLIDGKKLGKSESNPLENNFTRNEKLIKD